MNGIPSEPDYPNMNDLYVSEEKRGIGIGSKLINEAERIVKEKGYSKVGLKHRHCMGV